MNPSRIHKRITGHAVTRFEERIRQFPEDVSIRRKKEELSVCLLSAKAKHLRKFFQSKKRTVMVPTGCCLMICTDGAVVSIVEHPKWSCAGADA